MCLCVSADMLPYCSAHDEWLIMKLCMYVGYHHDANNVSNFGGEPVTRLNFKNIKKNYPVLRARHTIAVTRPLVLRLLLRKGMVWPCVEKRRYERCKACNNNDGGMEETSRKAQTEMDGPSAERFETPLTRP